MVKISYKGCTCTRAHKQTHTYTKSQRNTRNEKQTSPLSSSCVQATDSVCLYVSEQPRDLKSQPDYILKLKTAIMTGMSQPIPLSFLFFLTQFTKKMVMQGTVRRAPSRRKTGDHFTSWPTGFTGSSLCTGIAWDYPTSISSFQRQFWDPHPLPTQRRKDLVLLSKQAITYI